MRPLLGTQGQVARYIPALARVSPQPFGIALRTRDGLELLVARTGWSLFRPMS